MAKARALKVSARELDELVSHVLALRKDFVQALLRKAEAPVTGIKSDLRARLRDAITAGDLTIEHVVAFLDEAEPAGKQHVFLYRVDKAVSDEWRDPKAVQSRLKRRAALRPALEGAVALTMPELLELSRVDLGDGEVEVRAVQARRYVERDEELDPPAEVRGGHEVEYRAYVHHVARAVVRLRLQPASRTATLHITQATQRGIERDWYDQVERNFAELVAPWLDFKAFKRVDLHRAIHELHRLERTKAPLTRSRRARYETPDGSELDASSPGADLSVFSDKAMVSAIGAVATPTAGQTGNLFWLADAKPAAGRLDEDLHVTIVASDSRLHFMRPSSPDAIDYVLEQVRRLS